MIVAEDKKIKKCPVSLQPDIENLLQDLSPDDFASASRQEKDDFIQDRQSVSYWKDAWRRLKKNVVAMVALGVIVFLFLFAFVGPLLIPYGYDEFNKGAENLYPYHYTLEDTQRVNDEIASRTQSDVVDVDEMIAQAKAEAEKKGEKFTKKDEAVIRAKAKVAAKPSEDSSEEQSVDEDSVRKELGIKKHIFGYSQAELERKANGEKVFPHVFGTDMYGRDILVRVMYGARVSMSVGVFAAILVLVIGALYGAISGYCGGKVDAVMQRIVELIYAVPEMLVVLLIATALKPILTDYVNSSGTSPLKSFVNVLGPNLISMFIAFGLLYWVTMSRIIRGQVLQLKQQEYVTAARALGASGGRIIRRHLLPNCIGQIVVTTCLQIPSAILIKRCRRVVFLFLRLTKKKPEDTQRGRNSDGCTFTKV